MPIKFFLGYIPWKGLWLFCFAIEVKANGFAEQSYADEYVSQ